MNGTSPDFRAEARASRANPEAHFADLTGLRALVTGASSGIGRAIALELAQGGADVTIHCRESREAAEEVAFACRRLGREADVVVADLADHEQRSAFVPQTWPEGAGYDIWVNNAGADLLTGDHAHEDYTQKLDRLMHIDLLGTMVLSQIGRAHV